MCLQHWLGTLAFGLGIFTAAGAASLAPELGVDVSRLSGEGSGEGELEVGAAVGARFGILDDLEVGATFAPLVITPAFAYGNPRLWSTFRFLKERVEVGASLSVAIITCAAPLSPPPLPFQERGVVVQPGLPAWIHLEEAARLDVGVYVPIEFEGLGALGMKIPIEFVYDFVKAVHVAVSTGFIISNLNDTISHIFVPVSLSTGFALAGKKGPVLDIDPFFRLPVLFTPGLEAGHQLHLDAFVAGLEASYFLYL